MKTALPYGVADLILFDYIHNVCALIKLNLRLVWLNAFHFFRKNLAATLYSLLKIPNCRHSREGGNPDKFQFKLYQIKSTKLSMSNVWIPAFAGMTTG